MDTKKITGVYTINNDNDKIESLRAFLNITKQMYDYQKINLNGNDYTDYLKRTCIDIEEKIYSTIAYYQSNEALITEIRKAKEKCKDLSILFLKYIAELNELGIDKNKYLSSKKEIEDAFDFDLEPKKKKREPVENYIEIEKEFKEILDSINIENSAKTTNLTNNTVMFQLGVRLAIGDLDKYYTVNKNNETSINHGYSAPDIAKELKEPKWHKQILATLSYYQTDKNKSKNIWINKKTMKEVYKYCNNKKITMTDFFLMKYNQLPQD